MANYRTVKVTDQYREIVNMDTGVVRRIPYASSKQVTYLESLRKSTMKDPSKYTPLKNRPSQFAAAKQIDKLLDKKQKLEQQQRLV